MTLTTPSNSARHGNVPSQAESIPPNVPPVPAPPDMPPEPPRPDDAPPNIEDPPMPGGVPPVTEPGIHPPASVAAVAVQPAWALVC